MKKLALPFVLAFSSAVALASSLDQRCGVTNTESFFFYVTGFGESARAAEDAAVSDAEEQAKNTFSCPIICGDVPNMYACSKNVSASSSSYDPASPPIEGPPGTWTSVGVYVGSITIGCYDCPLVDPIPL